MASKKNKKSKHGIKHTHIEHHTDKSHTIRHSMMDGSEQSAATPDDAGMLEHMTDAMGSEAPRSRISLTRRRSRTDGSPA